MRSRLPTCSPNCETRLRTELRKIRRESERKPHVEYVGLPADETKTSAFADRLVQILNDGALNLMIGIGHRTRLFDTMAELAAVHFGSDRRSRPASTSATSANGWARW